MTLLGAATHPLRWARRRARLADWHTDTDTRPDPGPVWRTVRWHALAAAGVLTVIWAQTDPQAALGTGLLVGFLLLAAIAALLVWSALDAGLALTDWLRR